MVKTPYPPPKRKKMGNRVYRLVDTTQSTQEVIIMAKATKKAPVVTDDELEELDALEELDDLDEDDEEETVADAELVEDDDEDEDDEEAEPAPKKRARQAKNDASTPDSKPSRSRTTDGKVGTREIAEAAGVDGRTLRMVLRKHQVPKDPETGRYEWDSMKAKPVRQILKWIENGEAQDIKTAALDKLKADKAAKKAAKDDEAPAVKAKKGKKNKKNKPVVVVEDDDDE
jgi:hypothetical protein